MPRRLVRARTPLRISLGGGGTDIAPYPRDHGGVTLTVAIKLYAYVELIAHHDPAPLRVESRDLGRNATFECATDLELNGDLDLTKAAIRRVAPHILRDGLELITRSDVSFGSGLGGSSAMTATLLGALRHYLGQSVGHHARLGVDHRAAVCCLRARRRRCHGRAASHQGRGTRDARRAAP
jgi:D-glycero-alpha-D-manno-heptose-7-phosphate kinase